MDAQGRLRRGRILFEVRESDCDYSGLTIANRYLKAEDIEKSFFNGTTLTNCVFEDVVLNNTEFGEAKIEKCRFERTDLWGSDFVDSVFDSVVFIKCTFEKGELRDTGFRNCKFIDCNFTHTTITLCTFNECALDDTSFLSAQHRAVSFNVFSHCQLPGPTSNMILGSRNFGIPVADFEGQIATANSCSSIEQLCFLNNIGQFRVVSLADVVTSICTSLSGEGYRRASTLVFFSKILRILTNERRISATSLMYLEQLLTDFGSTISEQDLLMAAMTAILEIHSALMAVSEEINIQDFSPNSSVRRITIYFSETYERRQVEALHDALSAAMGISFEGISIEGIQSGSTLIELASTTVISVGALLAGLNFVLRQATVTVENINKLTLAVAKTKKKLPRKSKSHAVALSAPSKVATILQPDASVPALARIREAVQRNGRALVEVDEGAAVDVSSEQFD